MRQRQRSLLLGIAAVVVLGVLTAVLLNLPEPGASEVTEEPAPSPTGHTLLDAANTDVSAVTLTPKDGEAFTISVADNVCTVKNADGLFPDNGTTLSSTVSAALGLKALKEIDAAPTAEALKGYGLDKPSMTWRVTMKDGTYHDFILGGQTPTATGYYVRRLGGGGVYLYATAAANSLLLKREDYYKLGFLPAHITPSTESVPTWDKIVAARMETGVRIIDIDMYTQEELEAPDSDAFGTYRINTPYTATCNEYNLSTLFLIPITTIYPKTLVEKHPADVSRYGLDEPVRLTVTDEEGWTGTLLIGGKDPDTGGRYLMHEGVDAVILDTSGDYLFLDADPQRLRYRSLWLPNITGVASVDFDLDGVQRHLEVNYDTETKVADGYLDGRSISDNNTKNLYRAAIDVTLDDEYPEEIPDIPPRYAITIHFLNGVSRTLAFVPVNERHYAVVMDGENQMLLVYHSTIQTLLLDPFVVVDGGGEL